MASAGRNENSRSFFEKEGTKMPDYRIKVAPNTVACADGENRKLVVEFAIPREPFVATA